MNHTDHATRRFHLDSQRQGARTSPTQASNHPPPWTQSVLFWRELYGSQRDLKPTKMTMDVTHRKITTVGIQLKALDSDITGRHSKISPNDLSCIPVMIRGVQIIVLALTVLLAQRKASGFGEKLAGAIAFDAVTFKSMAQDIGNVVNSRTTRRDMQSGMMVTAGRTNHMIAGNTMWNPAYRQHVLQNMGKNWGTGNGRLRQR
ncbi:hypothetical protein [Achromobacter denitrificans]|uniref:hypothetical protein n=1 Tax=Achromobacter denitrificans TaxID=32002 RepID=UPI001F60854D|nr:hypothetical protein [Achromobacter denitrificans]